MNLKQLGILLVIVVVLGGAGLLLYRNQNASWQGAEAGAGKKIMPDLPVNDVARISITEGTNRLDLVKKDDLWRVEERHDYPANYQQIRDFLLKVQSLKAVQSEKAGPAQLASLHLAQPGQGTNSAVVVEFKGQNGGTLQTMLVGKPHLNKSGRASQFGEGEEGLPDGRYIRTGGSDIVAVVNDPLENVESKADGWLNKDFVRIDKVKSIEVDFPAATNSWKLTRETETGEWKLANAKPGEQLDPSKASGVSYPLSSPSFTDVMPGGKLQATGTNAPTLVKVETFDHFDYTMHVGDKTNETYHMTVAVTASIPKERVPEKGEKPADKVKFDKVFNDNNQVLEDKLKQAQSFENWTYLVSSWTIDPLLKERAQLLAEKKPESKQEAAAAARAGEKPELSSQPGKETPEALTAVTGAPNGETNSAPSGEP